MNYRRSLSTLTAIAVLMNITSSAINMAKAEELLQNTTTIQQEKEMEVPGGRKVVLTGDIQTVVGVLSWTPSAETTRMKYQGDGLYEFTIKDVPIGEYQYKVAMGSWDENYGVNGERGGGNISLRIPEKMDVTFYYSDKTHIITDSLKYKEMSPVLTGLSQPYTLKDYTLKHIYTVEVNLKAGEYTGLTLNIEGEEKVIRDFVLAEDKKVTFTYNLDMDIVLINNFSDKHIQADKVLFDSKDIEYKEPFGAVPKGKNVQFSLKAAKDDLNEAFLVMKSEEDKKVKKLPMTKRNVEGEYDIWSVEYTPNEIGMYKYQFILDNGVEIKSYGDDDGYFGTGKLADVGSAGEYDLNVYSPNYTTPDWIKNAVVYQILPDRFYNGDKRNDRAKSIARDQDSYEFYRDWYAPQVTPRDAENPEYNGPETDNVWHNEIYGGDLKGIIDKLDYLEALGVTVLYLNPITDAPTYHRYDTQDYKAVDPFLGNMDDFIKLAEKAKKKGMRIILDGVFNHTSDDSVYFDKFGKYIRSGQPLGAYQYWANVYDLMNEKGISQEKAETEAQAYFVTQGIEDFHYKDWYKVRNEKGSNGYYVYDIWIGFDYMPVIQNPGGDEYNVATWAEDMIDGEEAVSRFWLKNGASGWRLDAAEQISNPTWEKFRDAVKEEGDHLIVGEIWGNASEFLLGETFDSVTNYRFRQAINDFVENKSDAQKTMNELEKMREQYPKQAFEALLNPIDSHDSVRAISALEPQGRFAQEPSKEALSAAKLFPLIQMTYPGAPVIYYGNEAGMPGVADPDNRRGMIWGKGNQELVEWYATITNIRNTYPVLRTGDIFPIDLGYKDILAYTRQDNNEYAVVVVNRGMEASEIIIPVNKELNGKQLTDAITGKSYKVENGTVKAAVKKNEGLILVNQYKKFKLNTNKLKDIYKDNYIVKPGK